MMQDGYGLTLEQIDRLTIAQLKMLTEAMESVRQVPERNTQPRLRIDPNDPESIEAFKKQFSLLNGG